MSSTALDEDSIEQGEPADAFAALSDSTQTLNDDVRVEQDDPLRVAVTYTSGEDQLELIVDEAVTVRRVERS